jgi:hypothetical protein
MLRLIARPLLCCIHVATLCVKVGFTKFQFSTLLRRVSKHICIDDNMRIYYNVMMLNLLTKTGAQCSAPGALLVYNYECTNKYCRDSTTYLLKCFAELLWQWCYMGSAKCRGVHILKIPYSSTWHGADPYCLEILVILDILVMYGYIHALHMYIQSHEE